MPLTPFQKKVAKLLAENRTPDSYLAGGAALHFEPNSIRYSNDLDYFNDSVERVASAFEEDRNTLESEGFTVTIEMNQPGYLRATIGKSENRTKIEWSHDSSWRFMPTVEHKDLGYVLHPIDLAINKVLALAGRDEPRDFLDVMDVHRKTLPLGALCWAAAGKDPGFTPMSLIELLKRRGRYRSEDFEKLRLKKSVDLQAMKTSWLSALQDAETFIQSRPPDEIGCLYFSKDEERFIAPDTSESGAYSLHYGRPGGILPKIV